MLTRLAVASPSPRRRLSRDAVAACSPGTPGTGLRARLGLARDAESFEDAQAKGLHLLYASPVELQIDSILVELFRTITEHNVGRVVVDAIGELIVAASDRAVESAQRSLTRTSHEHACRTSVTAVAR